MITCLTCSLFPGMVLSTMTRELKVFFHVFEQHRYEPSVNAFLSLKTNTRVSFVCSAIFFLPFIFLLGYIKTILPLQMDSYFILLSVNSHGFNLCYICYVTCG